MKYKGDVPKKDQIRMSEFKLLPGDRVSFSLNEGANFYHGKVVEVGSANPEYVLEGPGTERAGMTSWNEDQRSDCENFIKGSPFPVKLKKSMWAVVEYDVVYHTADFKGLRGVGHLFLYTYDIEKMLKNDSLEILNRR